MKQFLAFLCVFCAAAAPLAVRAQAPEPDSDVADADAPPFEVPDVSESDFPFAPPADLADFVPIHQLELEAHPDGQTAAQRRRALKAVPRKSELHPRSSAIASGTRVLGWHPYWAEAGDYLSYDYSNLTHIAYFSAEVSTSGAISSLHAWNTDPVVEMAHTNGVKVLLTATLFGESSNHALLTNSAACNKLATNLVAKVTARGGDGICIDFESVGSWSGATKALTAFMSNLVAKAHAANLEVSICLPSVDWYADFAVGDYEKIGVDYSIIMGYDYYYAGSSTPGPVAPLYSSAQWQGASSWCSVDYSTRYYLNKMTNASHLMLAVPYYGRRWKSATTAIGSKSAGSSYSAAVTYPNAVAAAETHGRHWDTNSSCPYYAYTSGTNAYQCFYDDTESLGLKYDYAKAKGLGGVGIWCLTHAPESEELWSLLGDKFADYSSGGGTSGGGSASAPALLATGVSADSAVLSWTPAVEDPSGYVLQSAPTAAGLADGWWVPASGLFSNSFTSAEGWGSFTNTGTTNVTVAGATWTVHYSRLRAALSSCSEPGYVFMDANSSYIQTPPIHETVTQVTARVRAANTNYLDYRKATLLASTDSGASWQVLGQCPANSYTTIVDYPFPCSLQSDSGVLLMVSNTTDSTISGQTVILHQLTADYATSNWVTATGTTLADTCATALSGLSADTYYRIRNASSTNWSDPVGVFPGMVPSDLSAAPAATNIALSWTAAPGASAYQVDVSSGPYTNWTSTCPAASLGTNSFFNGTVTNTWCYTGTVRTVTTSSNLGAGPGYCSTTKYAGHYLAGYPGQALLSRDFPLYGATNATLSFSNCPWNAAKSTVGITCSTLRVYYRLDQGPWNFLGECRASSTIDTNWSFQSFQLPYLDGETLAVKLVAPYAERHADSTDGSLRGAGLKNVQLSFTGLQGRYCDDNRPEGYPKTVTAPSDLIEGLSPTNLYHIRVQALAENTRSVWVETSATTTEDTGGDQPSAEVTPVSTTWDFVATEGWSERTSNFTGATNVNGHAWELTACRVYPDGTSGDDLGYLSLYNPDNFSHAISPAFVGVVTQVTTIFRPSTAGTREVTLMASTDGGTNFTVVDTYPLPAAQNYTNTIVFSPALDGGDYGVIFCASNSGTAGTIHFRRLTIEGTSTAPEEPDADSYSPFGTSTAEQPRGPLSGVVVYAAAGHGYTANGQTNAWTTGRTITYGMVEDFGTIDQLNFFALQAWKAGATVVPLRPLGHQTNEVVIDNVDTAATLASRVTYGGNWGNTSQTDYYYGKAGDVGYRWADTCATGTTAWASYRPDLPAAGEYPVYVWARPGSDRVPQLYRVHHAGGVTDVRVDHRQVGNGWVWLGNYWFDAGTNGCVNISNYAPGFSDGTVIADAVRFGNGMGDISRGKAGISGVPRELEGARYWTQRMVADSQGLSATIYDSCGTGDQDDNVSAPNRMAYAMCRTNGWPRWRRIYLSFHSNASGSSRGCQGLYDTRLSGSYLLGQSNLARRVANAIVDNMDLAGSRGIVSPAWLQQVNRVYGSHYGEIYGGSIWAKMDNTIAEVAFHDKELDAAIMKSLRGREWLARSVLRGILNHLSAQYASDADLTVAADYAPAAPVAIAATNAGPGRITVSWKMPEDVSDLYPAHTGFVLYVSTNGCAFGNPVHLPSTATSYAHMFTDLPAGQPFYFRVCATNAGGESLESPVAGASLPAQDEDATAVLVVDGFRRADASLTPSPHFTRLSGVNGDVALVRPRMINSFDYVKEHGNAIAAANRSFDFMDASRVTSADLARYPKVVWCLGEESTADETFSYDEQQLLANYLSNGGALLVSGSEIGWDLWNKGSAADKAFMTNWLHCTFVDDDGGSAIVSGKSGTFLANTRADFNYTNDLPDIYAANSPDTLAPVGEAFVAATYGGTSGANGAIVACSNSVCRTVVMGFPFETITDATRRNTLMDKILDWFDAGQTPPAWIGKTAYVTGVGGEVAIDIKSQVTGFPSPAVTIVGSLDSRTGGPVADYFISEDAFLFYAPGEGTFTFTFRAANAALAIEQDVTVTAGNVPVWQPVGDILLDLDVSWSNNLYSLVSGEYPTVELDETRTVADPFTYDFTPAGYLELNSSSPVTNVFTFTAWNQYGTNSVTFTNVIRRLDTDQDGIPDWWAIQHFGGPTACNPNLDPDGDGLDNWHEFRLGTDPNDPSSLFALEAVDLDGVTCLYWPSATGLSYAIFSSTNLLDGLEAFGLYTNVPADPPGNLLPVSPTNPATFFRLQALFPNE